MRRVPVLLLGALLPLGGCRLFERDKTPADGSRAPLFGARPKEKDKDRPRDPGGASWLDGPGDRPATPASGRRGNGTLAGTVFDPDGERAAGVAVDVAPLGGGKPLRATTDDRGGFLVSGLDPGRTYVLTATSKRGGKPLGGQTYAQPTALPVQLLLLDGWADPAAAPDRPATAPFGTGRLDNLPEPKPLAADDAVPAPPSPSPDLPPTFSTPSSPRRPDLTTTIPSPTIVPPPPAGGASRESRSVRPEFVLVDSSGRPRQFPTGRAGELVLLDFLTTTCAPCKKSVPLLKELQARYGARGLDVVGVVCDEVPPPARRAVAAEYERTNELNYLLYIEPGKKPGGVMDRFGVESFPTLVLLSGDGDVLWSGDPRQAAKLEAAIRAELGR